LKAIFDGGNVRAPCPDCQGAITTFEYRHQTGEYGTIVRDVQTIAPSGAARTRLIYRHLRCASCGRGAMATIADNGQVNAGELVEFFPLKGEVGALPPATPHDIQAEYREAEAAASVSAWRAGSSMLRAALEKTLKANGYTQGNLKDKIDAAAADGVITGARQKRAHDDVRSLGNDILHDEWRPVDADEYGGAHHYVQRIIEDFYDSRAEVEALLIEKGRLAAPET
jgi:hypothetical protein